MDAANFDSKYNSFQEKSIFLQVYTVYNILYVSFHAQMRQYKELHVYFGYGSFIKKIGYLNFST